jgi:hypothetical protein
MDRQPETPWRNADVDWDRWPVVDYVAEVYAELSRPDAEVIEHHSAFYRQLPPDSLVRSLELGAGPNLYPLLLAAGASRRIDAVERSAANVAYLRRQLHDGPDDTWRPFYEYARRHNPALPPTMAEALSRVHVVHGDAFPAAAAGGYDLASMHFVAEGATEDADEFAAFCRTFAHSVRPGGYLVAAFIAGLRRYRMWSGPQWPAYPVDLDVVGRVFAPYTEQLTLAHVEPDQNILDHDATGMVLMTARRQTSQAP